MRSQKREGKINWYFCFGLTMNYMKSGRQFEIFKLRIFEKMFHYVLNFHYENVSL